MADSFIPLLFERKTDPNDPAVRFPGCAKLLYMSYRFNLPNVRLALLKEIEETARRDAEAGFAGVSIAE